MFTNSDKSIDEIMEELNDLIIKMIENYKKSKENLKERHYNLNDYFDCRVSNDTLHIHVVPSEIGMDFVRNVDKKLLDALTNIPQILNLPENKDVKNVFAVSKLLNPPCIQELFKKYGFETSKATDQKFIDMFKSEQIGQAIMSKEKFIELYEKNETRTYGNDSLNNLDKEKQIIQQKDELKKDSQPKFITEHEKKENERKIDKETKTVNPPVENKIEHENMKTKTNEHNMKNLSNAKKLVLTKKNNNKSNNAKNTSSGFASVVTLALITGFVAGALSMLVYYICK